MPYYKCMITLSVVFFINLTMLLPTIRAQKMLDVSYLPTTNNLKKIEIYPFGNTATSFSSLNLNNEVNKEFLKKIIDLLYDQGLNYEIEPVV